MLNCERQVNGDNLPAEDKKIVKNKTAPVAPAGPNQKSNTRTSGSHVSRAQGITLQAQQRQGRLPKLPGSARKAPVQASFAAAAPPLDPNVATELRQQAWEASQAEQAEQEVASQAAAPEPRTAPSQSPSARPLIR